MYIKYHGYKIHLIAEPKPLFSKAIHYRWFNPQKRYRYEIRYLSW